MAQARAPLRLWLGAVQGGAAGGGIQAQPSMLGNRQR